MSASTSSATQVRESLEASYKSTRMQLSRILAFKAHLHQHGAAQYGKVPQTMVTALKGEMDKFDTTCQDLEKRVMQAIAILRRDAERAANVQPESTTTAEVNPTLPSSEPASSAVPKSITSASQAVGPETITLDDDTPTQAMQLDLTLSPTPPPTTQSFPPLLPTSEPAPFALPTSTTDVSSSALPITTSVSSSNPSVSAAGNASIAAPSDDLNALLTSLNMPPFDPNAFLGAQSSSGGGGGGSTAGIDADALAALLGTGTTSAPPDSTAAAAQEGGGAGGGQDINLTGFDFSSISGLNTSTPTSNSNSSSNPTATSTSTSSVSAPAPTSVPDVNLGGGMDFDFSALGNGGQIPGLDGMDFSSFGGSGNGFDLSGLGLQGGGGGQMSEENLEELLKSLGG